MKNRLILTLGLLLTSAVSALAVDADGLLPYSNVTDSSIAVSTGITPAAVAVSSLTPTRIDSALNTALSSALGTNYKRAEVLIQVDDAAAMQCGFSTSVTTQTGSGFKFLANENLVSFKLGKVIGIYCQGVVSTGTIKVGGFGYR